MNRPSAEVEYRIVSDEAVVVSGRVPCWNCQAMIEVICLYCQSGFVDGEAMLHFSVSNISAVDEPLQRQLEQWPSFHRARRAGRKRGEFANHCPHCTKSQEDFYLHYQPGGIFFSFQAPGHELEIQALQGLVKLSGDEGFGP